MAGNKCAKCNKLFNAPSKLERHKNKKNSCSIHKIEYKCDICNVKFLSPAQQKIHENTNKHLNNLYNYIPSSNDSTTNQDLKNSNKELNNRIQNLEVENNNLNNIIQNLEAENNNLNNKIINLEIENQNTVNELNTQIKHLEVENNNLKNNQKLHPDYESIYIIHSAQHVNTNVYKIGRTENINARRVNYPSGSDLLYSFSCKDAKTVENTILDYLKNNKETFKLMDFGREYFQCDLKDLRNAVLKFID